MATIKSVYGGKVNEQKTTTTTTHWLFQQLTTLQASVHATQMLNKFIVVSFSVAISVLHETLYAIKWHE
jgi:hypothetical protein